MRHGIYFVKLENDVMKGSNISEQLKSSIQIVIRMKQLILQFIKNNCNNNYNLVSRNESKNLNEFIW